MFTSIHGIYQLRTSSYVNIINVSWPLSWWAKSSLAENQGAKSRMAERGTDIASQSPIQIQQEMQRTLKNFLVIGMCVGGYIQRLQENQQTKISFESKEGWKVQELLFYMNRCSIKMFCLSELMNFSSINQPQFLSLWCTPRQDTYG